jgi:hypothetical protein
MRWKRANRVLEALVATAVVAMNYLSFPDMLSRVLVTATRLFSYP